ncbi:MAG: hypothetical protein MK212_17815 [Saprospiraceae bacterium]|nr:hypothetical protein [Saprospiraceae bacterium]
MKNKRILIISGAVLVLALLAFFLFRRKPSTAALAAGSNPSSPYDYNYTIPQELEDGIVPANLGGNGTKRKTQLPNKVAFDAKVKTIIKQIMEGAPDNDWYQNVLASTQKFWTSEASMDMNQAVYQHAREFIAGLYFYKS